MFKFVGQRITPGFARLAAWLLVAVYVILATIGLTLQVITGHAYSNIEFPILISMVVTTVLWPVTGALIVSRHPRHPVGWLLIFGIIGAAFDMFSAGYVFYAIYVYPGALPGLSLPLIFLNWSAFPFLTTAVSLMILTFPTGRLPSPAWRKVAIAAIVALLLYLPLQALKPGPADPYSGIFLSNPLGVGEAWWAVLEPLLWVASAFLALCNLAAISSLFLRLRRARGEERQQIKWLFFPAAYYCVTIPLLLIALGTSNNLLLTISIALSLPAIAILVIAVAFAIFKYRLYDVDIIINRTVVYGAMTAGIVGLYILVVGGMSLAFQSNTNLAGVLLTIAIVVLLYRPLQARVRGTVDRIIPVRSATAIAQTSGVRIHPDQTLDQKKAKTQAPVREKQVERRAIGLPAAIWPLVRTMWFLGAAIVLGIIILSVPSQINFIIEATQENVMAVAVNIAISLAQSAGPIISLVLAGVLYFKRPYEGMALFLSYFLLVIGVISAPVFLVESIWPGVGSFISGVFQPLIFGPFLIAFLSIFPNGRLIPPWTKWLIVAAIIYAPVGPFIFTSAAYLEPTPIYVAAVLAWFVLIFTGLYAQIYRFRHLSNPEERQQIKWVVYAFTLSVLYVFFSTIWTIISNFQPPDSLLARLDPIIGLGWVLAYSTLPISLTIAVMRYRLYDIDIIINRTLVYGALTAGVAGLYVLVVGGAGLVVQTNVNLMSLVITAVITIVIIRPIRGTLQQGVDRLMYGKNGAPASPPANLQAEQTPTAKPQEETADLFPTSWLKIGRLAWYLVALLAFGICIAAVPGFIIVGTGGVTDPRFSPNPSPIIEIITWSSVIVAIIVSFSSLFLSLILFRRRSDDRMALLTSFLLLAYGIIISGSLEALDPFIPGIALFNSSYLIPIFQPFILLLFAVFPNGRFVPRWMRWVVLTAFLISPISLIWTTRFGDATFDYSEPWIILIVGITVLMTLFVWFSIIYGQIYRYRRVSSTQQKQQTKWVLYGISILIATQAITAVPWVYAYSLPPGTPIPIWLAAATPIWLISIAIVPLTLTIAVMRYRLFEIDFIINRSLMYGALTVVVVVIYILVVGSLGTFFQAQGNLVIALLATGIVAVMFQPLRERLQQGVNRLIYGERDDPVEALSRLGKQLETAVPPDDVLPMLVETIAQTLKLPYVGILLTAETEETTAVEYGALSNEPVNFPLTYQGEHIGRLVVGPHAQGSSFSPAEMRLLRNIARQAGAAAHAVQLTIDLQRSRQRLVTAREEERRRLRRDLHDGLGSTLAALNIQTNAVRRLIHSDPDSAETMIVEFKSEIREAIADIRRVVYELRPPTLDEMGLVGAVRAYAAQCSRESGEQPLTITIDAPDDLPTLPAAVEVAAYHIVREALTNVLNHAQAECCLVRLAENDGFIVVIEDDGIGLGDHKGNGVGLMSMRERAEELGGTFTIHHLSDSGTQVMAHLPYVKE